jgi:hypothetical protein
MNSLQAAHQRGEPHEDTLLPAVDMLHLEPDYLAGMQSTGIAEIEQNARFEVSRIGDSASVQAVTRVNAEQAFPARLHLSPDLRLCALAISGRAFFCCTAYVGLWPILLQKSLMACANDASLALTRFAVEGRLNCYSADAAGGLK